MLRISVINGPNLNLLGVREPEIYGAKTFEDFFVTLRGRFPGVELSYFQSNVEGELINRLHACMGTQDGIVLNAGAYTHTSIALADALAAVNVPAVEVHISNIYAREDYRRVSYTAARCVGAITGLGLEGYALAIQYLQSMLLPEAP